MSEEKEVVSGVSETEKVTKEEGELTDADLGQVSGGSVTPNITVNKAKTADKAYAAMDAYIKG